MLRLVNTVDEVVRLWPRIKELWLKIREQEVALPVDTPEDTLRSILNGVDTLFVWEVDGEIESMVLGSFQQYPRVKVFRLNALSGKLGPHWADCLKQIEDGARKSGAQGFEFWGRPGLAPFLKSQGYRVGMQHYIKELKEE